MRHGFIALFLVCALASEVNANDVSISFIGGVPHIQEEDDVTMASEYLRFRLFPHETSPLPDGISCQPDDEAEIPSTDPDDPRPWHCRLLRYRNGVRLEDPAWHLERYRELRAELTYTFRNQGEQPRTLEIGLPFDMPRPGDSGDLSGPSIEDEIEDFSTSLDGEEVPVTRYDLSVQEEEQLEGVRYNRLYSVTVSFEPGQERTLVHSYLGRVTTRSSGGGNSFVYLLRTGLGWAGPIGQVEIEFHLPDVGPCLLSSLPYTLVDGVIRVSLTDWEPQSDFTLEWETNGFMLGLNWEGWNVDYDNDGVVDSCQQLLAGPAEEHNEWAATVELAYGARQTEERLSTAESPTDLCDWADLFMNLVDEVEEWGNEEAAALLEQLRYHEDSRFPANIPAAFASCLERIRAGGGDE
ncbi:MAG: DUF4424 domain-containing protein [Proteobacteria bacterium]|nr:DUF4424 domain-containing protein [Pseudomonadota bacterium]